MPIIGTCQGLAGRSQATTPFLTYKWGGCVWLCCFLGLGLSLAIPTSQKPFLFTIYGTPLLGTPGWVVAPPFWELGALQGVLGRATRSPQSLPRANRLAKPDADRPSTETARRPASDRGAPPSTPASIKPKPHSCIAPEPCLAHPWEGLQFPKVAPRARRPAKPDADSPG